MQVSPQEYDLILRADMHTRGNTQWFYFAVRRMVPGVMYKFNILNNVKPDSLFNGGMQERAPLAHRTCTNPNPNPNPDPNPNPNPNPNPDPNPDPNPNPNPNPNPIQPLVYSTEDAQRHRLGWRRRAHSVCYYQNHIKRRSSFSRVRVRCLGSAPARLLRLLRARLAALGSSALPGRSQPTGRPATASGPRTSRLQSRRSHRLCGTIQVLLLYALLPALFPG